MDKDSEIADQNPAEVAFEDAWREGHYKLLAGVFFKEIKSVRNLIFGFTTEFPGSVDEKA